MRRTTLNLVLSLSLVWVTGSPALADEPAPLIAAAASLREVLPVLLRTFEQEQGIGVRLSFGASGNLRRQIAQGAPFELFLSADESFVLDLVREGHALDEGEVYAYGRLAILVPKGSSLHADGTLKDLEKGLEDGRLRLLAIANPEHAPYGRAAREVLQTLGLWEQIGNRMVIGESVSQAAQFASSGATDAGIVAYSLALSPHFTSCCEQAPLAAKLHQRLRQRGVLVKNASQAAHKLFDFILSTRGREILQRGGFDLPARD